MVITFLVPMAPRPQGGIMAIYEFANAMARLDHEVQLVHLNAGATDVAKEVSTELRSGGLGSSSRSSGTRTAAGLATPTSSPPEIPGAGWCDLDPRLDHHFPPDFDVEHLPDADFISGFGGEYPTRCGLPVLLVQGYGILPKVIENKLMSGPFPKLCTAHWLTEVCLGLGVAEQQAVYLPYGLKHEKYRLVSPIEDRRLRVAMAYNSHPTKGAGHGLKALALVKKRIPEAEILVFGANEPVHEIPAGITYRTSPPQEELVEGVYNQSRVFLNSSAREGFGLPCIEAMACGCALVTTDNGGSRDYAFHDETALVAPRGDVQTLADHIEALLLDDDHRLRLARTGLEFVKSYDWDASGRRLEAFLGAYEAKAERYRGTAPGWENEGGDG
jgi:glycosyltransferase involved in cell wall biosynthesis